jgi:Flavin containing amine oxidoreductase
VAPGHEVTVVEARDRVGGRTEGLVLDDGTPLELGGQWLGKGHTRMYELTGELGLSTFRTWNDEGQLLLDLRGRRSRMKSAKSAVPRISPFALADLAQGQLRFARLAARTDLERPWLTPGAELLDGQTWESWIRRNVRTKAGRAYFHIACEAVWAAQASDVSLLHALFYTHSNADLYTLLAVDRGAQQDRVTGGSVLVAEAMAAALGERVVPGAPGTPDRARRPRGPRHGPRRLGVPRRRGRRDAAPHAVRPAGLRPAAAIVARSAHPADASRLGHQDLRHLPRAVLAPGRAQRAGRLGYRTGEGNLRQLTAIRHARRLDGLPGGQPGAHLGAP